MGNEAKIKVSSLYGEQRKQPAKAKFLYIKSNSERVEHACLLEIGSSRPEIREYDINKVIEQVDLTAKSISSITNSNLVILTVYKNILSMAIDKAMGIIKEREYYLEEFNYDN